MHRVESGYPLFAIIVLVAQSFFGNTPIDGVHCDAQEGAVEHIHVHLQLFDRGKPIDVPAGIGIRTEIGCLYWLHTHASDGIIHIESPVVRTFTLGQFFDVWGVALSRDQAAQVHARPHARLRVTVNGALWAGNPRTIPLRDREEVVIQVGPPFARPHRADWSNL